MAEGLEALQALAPQAAAEAAALEPMIDAQGRAYATGKRKNAIARVWIKPGRGRITINGRDQETYFARPVLRMMIAQPLQIADRLGQFDVTATVKGPSSEISFEVFFLKDQARTPALVRVPLALGKFTMELVR